MDQMVQSEQFGTLSKIYLEKWCTTLHYFVFLYTNYGTKKLNIHLLEVHCSLEICHTTTYTLKNGIKPGTRCGRVQEYYNNYRERQGMGMIKQTKQR
jgi:hypothetical protein